METVKLFTKADNGKLSKIIEYGNGARQSYNSKLIRE